MSRHLHKAVKNYIEKDPARFHMPGHKGKGEGFFKDMMPWDITEVQGADSLFHADGPILALEHEVAKVWGSRRSLICAGGATLCIQTMLALACKPGTKVIMSRGIHRAAINACALLDLQPIWVYPRDDAGDWYSGRYFAEDIEHALSLHPDAAGVYITSPDYFGVISDLSAISQICQKDNVPLLVDNAHGAHLKFLPQSYGALHPMDCGVSICCDSLHKTMPSMTGAAVLHIGAERFVNDAKRLMSMFGSTSPSYPIMLSCEDAVEYAKLDACNGFSRTAKRLEQLAKLAAQKGLALVKGVSDPARLSLGFAPLGISAQEFGNHLRLYNIEPEYISETACVLMANGLNRESDFEKLEDAICALVEKEATITAKRYPNLCLEQAMTVREAAFSTQKQQLVENSEGFIAASEVSPCPPGIPVVMCGERISRDAVNLLCSLGISQVSVVA